MRARARASPPPSPRRRRLGYVGAGLAMGAANGLNVALTLAYIWGSGLAPLVLGGSWARTFQVHMAVAVAV